jgi:hypothetical protein
MFLLHTTVIERQPVFPDSITENISDPTLNHGFLKLGEE